MSEIIKQNWNESRERYTAFWNGSVLDRSPIIFDSVGQLRHPMYHGAGYDYTKYGENINHFCDDFLRIWEARSSLPDDTIPAICPQMGGAIEAAFWSGDISWGEQVTSMVPHNPLETLSTLRNIRFDPDNAYYRRILNEAKLLSTLSVNAGFGVNIEAGMSITTTISQLRGGTRFMFDIMDDPEGVRMFAEQICDCLLNLVREVDSIVPHPDGGTCHRWLNYWNPGSGFWFSEDDAMMLSPSQYRDLFLDLDRRLCKSAEYAVVHWHTGGLHLLSELISIPELSMIQLSFDPNGPPWEKVLEACKIIEAAGKRMCFQIEYDETRLKQIFNMVHPSSCMFYFGKAADSADVDRIISTVESMNRA